MTDTEALRAALAAGPTPGPWQDDADGVHRVHGGRHRVILSINISDAQREADAAYVAACSPDRIARLLDALDEAQREAKSWEQQASDRLDDALQFARERDAAKAKCPAPVTVPEKDSAEIDYSTGFDVGYATGWNAAVAAMKAAHD